MSGANELLAPVCELEKQIRNSSNFRAAAMVLLVNQTEPYEVDGKEMRRVNHFTSVVKTVSHLTAFEFATLFTQAQALLSELKDEAIEKFGEEEFMNNLQLVNQTLQTVSINYEDMGKSAEGYQDFWGFKPDGL